jgi:hypothetical protein
LRLEARCGIELPKDAARDRQSGDDEPTFGDEVGDGGAVPGSAEQSGGHILGRTILGQRAPDLFSAEGVSQSPASD